MSNSKIKHARESESDNRKMKHEIIQYLLQYKKMSV